ncbi:MAG: helix-turn-helix transcriptional regulator [Gemmatimonadales bacterium]
MNGFLGEFEQLILFAILQAGTEAYGAVIQREIESRAGRSASLGAVYTTLQRLEDKGLIASRVGDPLPERGGRRRKYYLVKPAGVRHLESSLAALRQMTLGLPRPLEAP